MSANVDMCFAANFALIFVVMIESFTKVPGCDVSESFVVSASVIDANIPVAASIAAIIRVLMNIILILLWYRPGELLRTLCLVCTRSHGTLRNDSLGTMLGLEPW